MEEGGGTSRNHSNVLQCSFLWSRVLGKLIVLGSFHPHLLRISYMTCQAARVRKEEFDGIPEITYCIYITYFMIHFLASEPSCDHPKLDNPLFSLRFNDQQSSKCRCSRNSKDLPPNHEELPLESLSLMRNLGFTLQPLSKLKWVVISSIKVILTRFSCLEWSSFYTWDSAPFIPLSASAKMTPVRGDSWESLGIKIGEEGGDVPVVPGSFCRTSKGIASLFFFSMAPEN